MRIPSSKRRLIQADEFRFQQISLADFGEPAKEYMFALRLMQLARS